MLPVQAQQGALVLQQNLAELVDQAPTIVHGRVLSVVAEAHPQFNNINTIVVSLAVEGILKGEAGPVFTFRQFIHDIRDRRTHLGYKVGQEVLLLMIKPSRYGLSSPAGLGQGRFRLLRDAQGNKVAVNGFNNRGLFRDIDQSAPKLGQQLRTELRQLITQHRAGPIASAALVNIIDGIKASRAE
jgi:hypothetical protein